MNGVVGATARQHLVARAAVGIEASCVSHFLFEVSFEGVVIRASVGKTTVNLKSEKTSERRNVKWLGLRLENLIVPETQ